MTYTQPLLLLFLGMAAIGLLRGFRWKSIAVCGVAGLFLLSWPPVDWLLARPLEAWYPVRPMPAVPVPQAIVVLSGSIRGPLYERPFPLPNHETVERCEMAAWLHGRWPALPVLACGGIGKKGQKPFSVTMREMLRRSGVPEALIWTEEASHSTHENAVYGAIILRQHGIRQI